ncbi:hypothetical protein A2454_07140 [Candidatus Peribacteria bacterium RIFOXYC2_FULL_55_14]|nr:MAG: F420-dependent oxidoreductase [Candidatus Peregrinibacteria bacterium GW2011_GWA2_54_9]OGJ73288.1 MAG: hypothetical protein A2217_04390 [Candidatus Peribacteria bacterium RIFOXYA2_FULL_55_28]OGJ74779.1 MAG: hypothetical protein A2384_07020 [Candidatus Peribacteria bacterium RIFOXYB1_FULL_54_35]OGJ76935.1 MAG: hypothetical protein A2327_06535 [Candidatus Peribacteria bacterium RIFOXYB2_FULL_54_17]OGJ77892.1 MAG: hypothetical protein A2424_04770 [Candidatus Peribacteria bacterium RIFOXYC1
MFLQAIRTGTLKKGTSLSAVLAEHSDIEQGDILVVSSKACAVTEGHAIDLSQLAVSPEAEQWAKRCGRSPAFRQAVLNETRRMHGTVIGSCPKAMLCELKPDGLEEGTIFAVNAGLDTSNVEKGYAVGWPKDPVATVSKLRRDLESETGKRIAVILTDSCCRPRRLGVTAFALTVCGIEPLLSQIGRKDIFGHELTMTHEAIADQLATAANFLMGNADQSVPAVLIRDHGLSLTDFCGWVPGIAREEDLFRGLF